MRVASIKKKLREAGIPMEELKIEKDCIEICAGYKEIDRYGDGTSVYGECDENKVRALMKRINKAIPSFNGGSYTGYGALRLQENYQSMGDWNDPGSKWHY